MTGTKIVIIVLVVIAALFVVLMIWGSGNNSSEGNANQPPSFLTWLGQLGGGSSFDIKQLQPSVKNKTFDLARQANYQFTVLADSDHPFRQAAFKVQPSPSSNQSCAQVIFTDPSAGNSSGDDPDHQKLKNPQSSHDSKNKNWNDFTITIPKGGGGLLIERSVASSTAPCTVTLQ
jgi:hypothetical protein